MEITDLLAFKKEKAALERELQRIVRYRFLGSSCHTALFVTHHLCIRCHTEISGGMAYVREVYAIRRGISVRRYHSPICPDYYWRIAEQEREEAEERARAEKVA